MFTACLIFVKDTHREKAPSNKTPTLWKSMNMDILGGWYIKSTLNTRIVKTNIVTGKTPFFVIGLFCTPHSICLNILASDRAVLYKNVAFSILLFSAIKQYSSFLKWVCVFQKTCLEAFERLHYLHIKICRSPKRKTTLKIRSTIF